MKKLIIALLPILALAFASCQQTPDATAKAYQDAIKAGNFEKAKEYVTEGTKQYVDVMATFDGFVAETNYKATVVGKSVIEGDNAKVTVKNANDANSKEETLTLTKVNGKWFVNLEAFNPAEQLPAPQATEETIQDNMEQAADQVQATGEKAADDVKEAAQKAAQNIEQGAQKVQDELKK